MTTLATRRRHRALTPTSLVPLIALVLGLLLVYIALSILIHPSDQLINFNFKSERGSITLLSCLMLFSAGCLAGWTLRTLWDGPWQTRSFWAMMTVGLPVLAADEVLQFHERFGDLMKGDGFSAGPFRNWNDILVISYGLIAIPIAILSYREIRRYPRLLTMIGVAAFFYVATTGVDSTMDTTVSVIVEESLKVTCSTFLMLSMATGLVAARWLRATRRLR
jgi:hypothetical protein